MGKNVSFRIPIFAKPTRDSKNCSTIGLQRTNQNQIVKQTQSLRKQL